MTIKEFIEENKISMEAEWADENPNMDDMMGGSTHYKCILKRPRKQMTVYFSQGPAIYKEPTVEDVLDCLASDSCGVEELTSFEDWANDYGYDTDSRKAENTFKAVMNQATKLRIFLGESAFEKLLICREDY